MRNIKRIQTYSGQGFIEALIALIVAAVACMFFIDSAIKNMQIVLQIEQADKLLKISAETAQKVRQIAEYQNSLAVGNVFPPMTTTPGNYFELKKSFTNPRFKTDITGTACSSLAVCKSSSTVFEDIDSNIFSVYTITSIKGIPTLSPTKYLVTGKVISGLKDCETLKGTTDCKVGNQEYSVAVYIEK